MGWRSGIAASVSLTVAMLGAQPALAAHPGQNGKIAFLRTPPTDARDLAQDGGMEPEAVAAPPADLAVVEPDRSGQRRLIRRVQSASFSPDGTRLVLLRPSGEGSALIVADADGRSLKVLARRGDHRWAQFSPDGRQILFARVDSGRRSLERLFESETPRGWSRRLARVRWGLYAIGVDGTAMRRIVSLRGALLGGIRWSPDGSRIAAVRLTPRASEIVSVNPQDGTVARIKAFGERHGVVVGGVDFSPRGNQLAFNLVSGRPGIHVMGVDGSGLRRLPRTRLHDSEPVWSPDGRLIAFTRPSRRGLIGLSHVYTTPASGGRLTRLTREHANAVPASWQPLPV